MPLRGGGGLGGPDMRFDRGLGRDFDTGMFRCPLGLIVSSSYPRHETLFCRSIWRPNGSSTVWWWHVVWRISRPEFGPDHSGEVLAVVVNLD